MLLAQITHEFSVIQTLLFNGEPVAEILVAHGFSRGIKNHRFKEVEFNPAIYGQEMYLHIDRIG